MTKKITWKKTLIALLFVGLLLMIARKSGWMGSENRVRVSAEKATQRTIVESVTASGKIQPETQVKISPDVSGEITELHVKEGQKVKKGDLLCKIKQDNYLSVLERTNAGVNGARASFANSQARVLQAETQLENAKSIFERQKKLFEQSAISQQEFDGAKASFENARAEVEAAKQSARAAEFNVRNAEATSKEASDNLGKTMIYAPVDGIVSKLNVEKGERVVGTSQMAGTEIMNIANVTEMEVNVDVNENDIVRVSLGDTAKIEVDAYVDKKFLGIVTEIANSASTVGAVATDQVTSFQVKVRILRESYVSLIPEGNENYSPFRPGMTASVEVLTQRVSRTLGVPVQAVTTREDTTSYGAEEKKNTLVNIQEGKEKEEILKQYVFVVSDGVVLLREVKTGIQDNDYIQILSGVKPGEEVISAPYKAISKTLRNKTPIELVTKEELIASMQGMEE